MRDNDILLQDNLDTVVSGVKALSILSKILQETDGGHSIKKDNATMESVLREFSTALLSSQKNNLDTPCHATKKQTKSYNLQNNSYSSECCSTEGNDNDISLLILTDSESRDKDDQSEPELDYEEELLSRRIYYDQYENSEATTPKAKRNSIPASVSTPLASSTMIDDCSKSALRNNRRRTKRSNPIISSTMMEDLIDEVQKQHHETCAANTGSVVTWSIDNSIKTESLEDFYNIFSDLETENQSRNNNCQKKNSKCKQSVSKLLMFIKGIKRNLTRKTSSMNNRR
ncbi:Hypothetical predicted protein [Mytilus galloprovincialis]|uniref:Uncharacterized protein n=1 Tax=Mytilus galloprovincialis TaxID=29158 RepID=A0A8B6D6E1_MYTGA|nr:Hypothetical predicted protein [Mytilus galloprovincialis]